MNHHQQFNDRSCPDNTTAPPAPLVPYAYNTVYDSPSGVSANGSFGPSDNQDSRFTRPSVYPAPVSGQMQLGNQSLQSTRQPPSMLDAVEFELYYWHHPGPYCIAPCTQCCYIGPHLIGANPNPAMPSTTGPYVNSSFNEGLPTQYAGLITAAQIASEIPRIAGQPSKRARASSSSRTRKKRKTQHPSPSIIQNSDAVQVPPQDTPEAIARFETNPNSLPLTPHSGPSHHELDTIANLDTSSTYAPESTQSNGNNPSVTVHGKAVPVDPQLLSDESNPVTSQQAQMAPISAPSLQQYGSFSDEWLSRPENQLDHVTLTGLDSEPAANEPYSFPEIVLQTNEQPSDCYGPPPIPPPKNWNVGASHEGMALAESAGNVDNTTPLSHFQRNATQGVNGEVSVSAEYRSVQPRPTQPSHAEPSGVIHHTYPQEPAQKSNHPIVGFHGNKFKTNGIDIRDDRYPEEDKNATYKHFVDGFIGLKTYVNRPDPEQTSASSGSSGSDQKPASSQGSASGGGSMSGTGSSSKSGKSSLKRKANAKEKSALKATANRRNKSGKEEPRGQETDPDLERSSPTPNPEYVDFRARIAYKPIGWLIELCKQDWEQENADWETQGKKARQKRKYTEKAKQESNETSAAPIQRKQHKYVPVEYHLALAGVTCPETVWVACNKFHVWRGIVFLDDGHPRDNGATILLPDEKNEYPSLENDRPFDAQEWDNDYRYAYLPEVLRPRTLKHRRDPKGDKKYPREDKWPKKKYKPQNNDRHKEGDLYQSSWIRSAPKRDKKWIWDEKHCERQAWCHYCDPNQKKECHLCNKKNMTNDEKDECDKETWWFSITKSRYNYHMRTRHGILPNGKHVPLAPILKKERCKKDPQKKKWMVFCIACIKWCNLTGKDPNRNKWWADIDVCALHKDGSAPPRSLQKSKHSNGDP
ncbi:hypothetical protein KEM56_007262 [Ascosphaera pollenicola]|nr:hypothetical protein KEM56_007262 [Ascosphaera pollenicola]